MVKGCHIDAESGCIFVECHRDGGEGDARTAKNALVDIQNNISRSNLDLMDTYQGVFAYDNKGNKEIIFTIHNELFEYNLWNGNNDLFPQADYLGKFYNADGTLINTSVENNFGIMRLMVKLETSRNFCRETLVVTLH